MVHNRDMQRQWKNAAVIFRHGFRDTSISSTYVRHLFVQEYARYQSPYLFRPCGDNEQTLKSILDGASLLSLYQYLTTNVSITVLFRQQKSVVLWCSNTQ